LLCVSLGQPLLASMATVGFGWVKVKLLPFDNKSEFQVILNMPEGSSLEHTARAAREIAAAAWRPQPRSKSTTPPSPSPTTCPPLNGTASGTSPWKSFAILAWRLPRCWC
jgi:hypothetical protein